VDGLKNAETFTVAPSGDHEIVMTRVFDATRPVVFAAHTMPELVKRWLLGPPGWSMPICEIDLRRGGKYRHVLRRDADGMEMGWSGVYREVVPPERLVATESFDDAWHQGEALVTTVLAERGGKTMLTTTMLFESREARDAVLKSGMDTGVAVSYDRLEELSREIEMAREVQARLLPRQQPPLETLDYRARCHQLHGLGGDYYDFLHLDSGKTGFVLTDISGKGIPAALLMASLQASIRSQHALALDDLPRLLRSVNRLFGELTESHRYASVFFGIYDDSTRRLRYENCGHNPPLLVRRDGRLERLQGTATVLGMFERWDCSVTETQLQPGDVLVIYSDGVTEARSGEELYGETRLLESIRAHREQPVEELLEAIVADVDLFSGRLREDDLTLIVARCK